MQTQARRRSGGKPADGEARWMTELAQAFRAFEDRFPGLSVDVVGHLAGSSDFVHPIAGFHVHLGAAPSEIGVSLYVSARYAELVKWTPGAGALRERFDVSLDDLGYGWGGSLYPTAAELAHDLIAYMQFNLDALRRQ
jgi:hypothetical protein